MGAFLRGKHVIRELGEFLRQEGEDRRGTLDMSAEQQADIQAFCDHVAKVDLQAEVIVDDEAEIVVGDVATCRITMTRKNLKVRIGYTTWHYFASSTCPVFTCFLPASVPLFTGRRSCGRGSRAILLRTQIRGVVVVPKGEERQCLGG